MDRTLVFSIDGFKPDTLPLNKLAEYLKPLATLYGSEDQIHFACVSEGSAAAEAFCDTDEVFQATVQACALLQNGEGNEKRLKALDDINRLLRRDKTFATLYPKKNPDCKIIQFPGIKEQVEPDGTPFHQATSIQGQLIRIGGTDSSIPVWLKDRAGHVHKSINVNEVLAKRLSNYYLGHIRLEGMGEWYRSAEGEWIMKSFSASDFTVLSNDSLHDIVRQLRAIPGNGWNDLSDPFGHLDQLRDE